MKFYISVAVLLLSVAAFAQIPQRCQADAATLKQAMPDFKGMNMMYLQHESDMMTVCLRQDAANADDYKMVRDFIKDAYIQRLEQWIEEYDLTGQFNEWDTERYFKQAQQ